MRAFLCQVLSRAQSAGNLQTCRDAQQIWRSCIADLRRVSELDSKLAAMARCAATFLQCQLLMDKVKKGHRGQGREEGKERRKEVGRKGGRDGQIGEQMGRQEKEERGTGTEGQRKGGGNKGRKDNCRLRDIPLSC